jgi:ribosomal protein S18 acetylase RimI-like enzyme
MRHHRRLGPWPPAWPLNMALADGSMPRSDAKRARRAELRDVEAIQRICTDGWRDTYRGIYSPAEIERVIDQFYNRERLSSEIEHPEGWDGWWVAEDEEREVLAAGGGGLTEPGVAEVFVLYADPRRRGEGAGSAILDAITDEQRSKGAREQWVSVEPENEIGLAFYRARGFVQAGSRPAYQRDGISLRLRRGI